MNLLDLRNKIGSYFDKQPFKRYIEENQDRFELIEVLLFNCQVLEHTAKGFNDFVSLLPNLKYLDLGVTHTNGSGHDIMVGLIKELVGKGVIVDMRKVGYNIRNRLKDFTHENLYKDNNKFHLICDTCVKDTTGRRPETKCNLCKGVDKVGRNVNYIIYHYPPDEITQNDITNVINDIKDIIDNVPDFVVDEVCMYLINNKMYHELNPKYPIDKITKINVKTALVKYLKEFSISRSEDSNKNIPQYKGVIFSIFDLGDYGSVEWMFGWKSLFKCDGWRLCFDYVECDKLYNYIK